MKIIGDFFDKFRKISNQSLIVREAVLGILDKDYSIKINKDSVKFRDNKVYINISGSAKMEITTQQKDIIQKINAALGKEIITKIL